MKDELFAPSPLTVTENGPDDAPEETNARILVSLQLIAAALIPFNEIVLLPCDPPKPVPVIVTSVPTGPEVGARPVMLGPCA